MTQEHTQQVFDVDNPHPTNLHDDLASRTAMEIALADDNARLRSLLHDISECLSLAVEADMENGCKALNELACTKMQETCPEILAEITRTEDRIADAVGYESD